MEIRKIKESYKTEKKNAKKSYRKEKKTNKHHFKQRLLTMKEQYVIDVSGAYLEKGKREPINPPRRPTLEEIGNAVSHGLGSLFAVIALILMLSLHNGVYELIGAVVYFVGLFVMFTMSCLYHAFPYGSRVKRIFRRFDYSCIYLLIGATFAPILLCYVGGVFGILFFTVQWAVIITGITFVCVFGPGRLRWLHMPLYIILGWSGLLFVPKMLVGGAMFVFYILGGGVIYSLGIIPFAMKNRVAHFIWHFFVLAGAIMQWFGIYLYIYR